MNSNTTTTVCSNGTWTPFSAREVIGRDRSRPFENNAPLGFEAGDANFYRYVGNDPTNATDPSGLQKQAEKRYDTIDTYPKGIVYWDEEMWRMMQNELRRSKPAAKELRRILLYLRDLKSPHYEVNYYFARSGVDPEIKFAQDAVQKDGNSINVYVGHGKSDDKNAKRNAQIGEELARKLKPIFAKAKPGARFAFAACNAGYYNEAAGPCVLAGALKDKKPIGLLILNSKSIPEAHAQTFRAVEREVKARLEKKKKVVLNIYFAMEGSRARLNEAFRKEFNLGKEVELYPSNLSLRVNEWK